MINLSLSKNDVIRIIIALLEYQNKIRSCIDSCDFVVLDDLYKNINDYLIHKRKSYNSYEKLIDKFIGLQEVFKKC